MKLPRHAELWGPGYLRDRGRRLLPRPRPRRVWLTVADHYEPRWGLATRAARGTGSPRPCGIADARVARWVDAWPVVAAACRRDAAGQPPCHTFFYPQEEYAPRHLDALAALCATGIGDVEIHIHHDADGRAAFIEKMSSFRELLHARHGLLRRRGGRLVFGFIHGNWALDNSLPDGRWCGLNDELSILRDLGCYADFTMPAGDSPCQARTVNTIYWAVDDPERPKSYDGGRPVTPGGGRGDLLIIPGPLGIRWAERLAPRLEAGEIAANDPPTPYRLQRWLALAPRIGADVFVKLHTHGAQEKNAEMLLGGGLRRLYDGMSELCARRGLALYYASAWQMALAVEALQQGRDPLGAALAPARGVEAKREAARVEIPC